MESQNKKEEILWKSWWKIDKKYLDMQVEQYNTLKIHQSERGKSFLLIIVGIISTLIMVFYYGYGSPSILPMIIFFILGLLIYKGQKWAMVMAMLFWIIWKGIFYFDKINNKPITIYFDVALSFMCIGSFYRAFLVERLRMRVKRPNQGNAPAPK